MNTAQAHALVPLLQLAVRLYHGCCRGADEQAHILARTVCNADLWIEGYPSSYEQSKSGLTVDIMHAINDPIARNKVMIRRAVQAGNPLVLATPKLFTEEVRGSGTWATIREARRRQVPHRILWPDGRVDEDAS